MWYQQTYQVTNYVLQKRVFEKGASEIDTIFRVLFPEHGMAVREEQILLCHEMLDNLLGRNIALCDAGVGIGKTYAYLVACVLMRKYSLLADGYSPYEQRPVVISTSSIALQKAILTEYIPFSLPDSSGEWDNSGAAQSSYPQRERAFCLR